MRCYLAGPINDCSDNECIDWREKVKSKLPQIDFVDPMVRDYRGNETTENAIEIVEQDKNDIDSSDIVLVYHDRPSVGTSMEILYAWEHGKFILTVGCTGKPLSPWIVYHSSHVVNTLEDAITTLDTISDTYHIVDDGDQLDLI